MVAGSGLREQHNERAADVIADGVKLGVQFNPPLVRPIQRGKSPFLEQARSRAVRLEVRGVDHDPLRLRPFTARPAKMRSNTPSGSSG